ncbi:MAG: PaaI family thioesterase, partial [Thermoanaerobaculia bacterium]
MEDRLMEDRQSCLSSTTLLSSVAFCMPDHDAENAVRQSFTRQKFMATIGARLIRIEPGVIEIELPFSDHIGQQTGFVHGGVISAIADTACGYAALTLMPAGSEVVSVEFKVNLLAPAQGERFLAQGRVIRAGKTLMVCSADV